MMRKAVKTRHRYVFRRDKWTCKMPVCFHPGGRSIDRHLHRTDSPWAPSVDHIIPKSLGGKGNAGNLRAAHRACNEARADGKRVFP